MGFGRYTHLEDCSVLKVTYKAVLVAYEDTQVWLPKSVVDNADVYEEGDEDVTISVESSWWERKQREL